MSRPVVTDPRTGDECEAVACDLCGVSDRVVLSDWPVMPPGWPWPEQAVDVCHACRDNEWDKVEALALDRAEAHERRWRATAPDSAVEYVDHMRREGRLPDPHRPLPERSTCRVCGAPSCDCDRITEAEWRDRSVERERTNLRGVQP